MNFTFYNSIQGCNFFGGKGAHVPCTFPFWSPTVFTVQKRCCTIVNTSSTRTVLTRVVSWYNNNAHRPLILFMLFTDISKYIHTSARSCGGTMHVQYTRCPLFFGVGYCKPTNKGSGVQPSNKAPIQDSLYNTSPPLSANIRGQQIEHRLVTSVVRKYKI